MLEETVPRVERRAWLEDQILNISNFGGDTTL